ncbi:anaphase-promoting complex subunit CDC23 [Ascobolus immersus RN42]|uniref:Anaphase-promoting complex subunit CDC23 n=1 Tax=Ascobolus immersus RN42 TaxID=1160509 RepID=A0A3N4HFY6_ASCIM|nr:anaphase-promoting complex subunit CDC23 [Ascobolus immersus RN42]
MAAKIDLTQIHTDLQVAVQNCSDRCLYHSAKWAAELLNALPPMDPPSKPPTAYPHRTTYHQFPVPNQRQQQLEFAELSKYLLAKTYFDVREYDRCSNVLGGCQSSKSRFLCLYSKYMAGEKRREEEMEFILSPQDGHATNNKEVLGILASLENIQREWEREGQDEDPWILYLYGVMLLKQKNEVEARRALCKSVNLYPYHWGAWLELATTLNSLEDMNSILPDLPSHILTNIFHLHTNQELYQFSEKVHAQLTEIEKYFPRSQFLKTQRALLHYHGREFDEAETIFDGIMKEDPHRLDALDHYSNILYVMERRPKLGFLAQLATQTDRFRPETCCVVGNYYSLKSEHEKAVTYFRRALTLDRNFLSAWTLMGHEYVEMKNTHAAIEAYRRAVDVNRKDYRAWYGLGLSYEFLEMQYYALFYFQRAASLRPYDPQMWQAMGNCFDKMNRPHEAIKAFKRALIGNSYSPSTPAPQQQQPALDPDVLFKIGMMYQQLNDTKEAAKYLELCVKEANAAELEPTINTSKARMWLARWEFSHGHYDKAELLANELVQDGIEIEEAKALVRDSRSRMAAMGSASRRSTMNPLE